MASERKTVEKYIVLVDGTKIKVTSETGRYYICENGSWFSRRNPDIRLVEEAKKETRKKSAKKGDGK